VSLLKLHNAHNAQFLSILSNKKSKNLSST